MSTLQMQTSLLLGIFPPQDAGLVDKKIMKFESGFLLRNLFEVGILAGESMPDFQVYCIYLYIYYIHRFRRFT